MTPDYSAMPLWQREQVFLSQGPELPEPQFAILWKDPSEGLDAPCKVTVPAPAWMAMAMHGGILPPVEVYHELAADEAKPGFKRHTRGNLLHETTPVPSMTEEEAMEYLVKKDIPPRVWRDYRGNWPIMRIVRRETIPADREFRDAWTIEPLEAA